MEATNQLTIHLNNVVPRSSVPFFSHFDHSDILNFLASKKHKHTRATTQLACTMYFSQDQEVIGQEDKSPFSDPYYSHREEPQRPLFVDEIFTV